MASDEPLNYRKYLLLLIAISTILRLLFIGSTELSADEVYYWSFAIKPEWNYFDHPPAVAWLIRLCTVNLFFHNSFFVRIGAVICCAICTWLFFEIGRTLKDFRTGWFAALLYSSSIYGSVFIGGHILPDSPQMVFWLLSILLLLKRTAMADDSSEPYLLWCLFGFSTGLSILCKVHGVFLWPGVIWYTLTVEPNWLKKRGIYLAAVITMVIVSPIIIWNIQNDFITYKFHSSRVYPGNSGINLWNFGKVLLKEISLCNPVNFFLICLHLFLAFKQRITLPARQFRILLCCSLPLIMTVLIISLFRETHPHWPAPAYTCLLLLPAIGLAAANRNPKALIPKVIRWALVYMLFVALLEVVLINYFPGTTSLQKEGLKTGVKDLTLDMYGWEQAAEKYDSLYRSDVANHRMLASAPVIVTNWSPGASIEFYMANQTGQRIIGIGNISDLHQYYWRNKTVKPLKKGDSAYYIIPSSDLYYRTLNLVKKNFKSYDQPVIIPQYRSGLLCRYLYIYRMTGFR